MAEIVGLDFGTTNSLVSVVVGDRALALTDQVHGNMPHPSAVWFHGSEVIVGREAKAQLAEPALGVVGGIVRSPKAFLGRGENVTVDGVSRSPSDVVGQVFQFLKSHARGRGYDFDRAVVTIPVTLDGRGRRELRDAAAAAGVRIVQFVHEPLAALYGYLREQDDFDRLVAELQSQLVLVFDWGGGTLDLTLCQLTGHTLTQVANLGNREVGGDRFDDRLRNFVLQKHLEQHGITTNVQVEANADRTLIQRCEGTKIELSHRESSTVFVQNYLRGDGPDRTLEVVVTRDDLQAVTKDIIDDGISTVQSLLERVGRSPEGIELCLATGGMVNMPRIRERLIELFGARRLPTIPHGDRIISEGAAWIGHDHARLSLAKPVELLHADDSYVTIVPAHATLPIENETYHQQLVMYCVDPEDGYAKFHFVRPAWPTRAQPLDHRMAYANLILGVDPTARPLRERLVVDVTIDHDLVAEISVRSTLLGDEQQVYVHDLEFGLRLGRNRDTPDV
jgi:molecular chaperone DnaK